MLTTPQLHHFKRRWIFKLLYRSHCHPADQGYANIPVGVRGNAFGPTLMALCREACDDVLEFLVLVGKFSHVL